MSNIAVRNGELPQLVKFVEVSKLQNETALRAVRELRQPDSKITHLVFCSPSRRDLPGPDYHLTRLLDVRPSVQHFQYERGYFDSETILSVFRNFSSKNRDAYVLLVCSEFTLVRSSDSRHRGQEARAVVKVEDLQIRLKVTDAELALVRKKKYEAQVSAEKAKLRAEKAEARLRLAEIKLGQIALITRHRSART